MLCQSQLSLQRHVEGKENKSVYMSELFVDTQVLQRELGLSPVRSWLYVIFFKSKFFAKLTLNDRKVQSN